MVAAGKHPDMFFCLGQSLVESDALAEVSIYALFLAATASCCLRFSVFTLSISAAYLAASVAGEFPL